MDYFSSNPIHTEDLALTLINEDEEEPVASPLDSPLDAPSQDASKGWGQMKSSRSAILSPRSASVSVLSKRGSEAPRADTREHALYFFWMRNGADIFMRNRISTWWSTSRRSVIATLPRSNVLKFPNCEPQI